MKSNVAVPILILFIIFSALSFYIGSKYSQQNNTQTEVVNQIPEGTVCTMDIKVCPDGTEVGRTGPQCQFAPCPVQEITNNAVEPFERGIRYAKYNNSIIIDFNGVIYEEGDDAGFPKVLENTPANLVWKDLQEITIPTNTFMELFGFKILPNSEDFILVARYDFEDIHIYTFTANTNTFEESLEIKPTMTKTKQMFPKIVDTDSSGNFVSFNMFSCWNCGGHIPSRLLWNRETSKTKDIEQVSYFAWKENGNYEYKDFVEIPCEFDGPGICNEDPNNLPLKTGKF